MHTCPRSQIMYPVFAVLTVCRIRSSRYLPLHESATPRSSSLSSSAEQVAKKDSKLKMLESNTKRRATMNSRVAYDEDEMLRRAIEESKEMGSLGKRQRDESEECACNDTTPEF